MSVINQMLIELDKRGAAQPPQQDAVRAVVVARKHRYGWYALAGVILLVAIAAWLNDRQYLQPGLHTVKTVTVAVPPAQSAQLASRVAAIAQPVPASAVFASGVAQSEDAASAIPAAPTTAEHMVPVRPLAALQVVSAVAAAKANDSARAPSVLSKQLKPESVQQQAENAFRKGNRLLQQGKAAEAIDAYTEALRLDSGHAQAREALVATLIQGKRNAEAEQRLQDTLHENPAQPHFAMLLARLQVERDAVTVALDTLENGLPYARKQPDYEAFLAALLQRQNRKEEAVAHYQAALQIEPDNGIWLMGLGISLQALARNEAALAAYRKASTTNDLSVELREFVRQRIDQLR